MQLHISSTAAVMLTYGVTSRTASYSSIGNHDKLSAWVSDKEFRVQLLRNIGNSREAEEMSAAPYMELRNDIRSYEIVREERADRSLTSLEADAVMCE